MSAGYGPQFEYLPCVAGNVFPLTGGIFERESMEVKKVATYISQSLQQPKEVAQRPNADEKAVSGKDASLPPDRVELSKGYQEMAQVKKVMMERGDVRMEQVDQIRSMIEKGTYQVDPEKIAEKMLEELM